jgi:hypothetical protein
MSYSWNAGDIFDGEFLDNVRHGRCRYTWATGDTVTCEWIHGSCPAWEAKNDEINTKIQQQKLHCEQQPTVMEEIADFRPPLPEIGDASATQPLPQVAAYVLPPAQTDEDCGPQGVSDKRSLLTKEQEQEGTRCPTSPVAPKKRRSVLYNNNVPAGAQNPDSALHGDILLQQQRMHDVAPLHNPQQQTLTSLHQQQEPHRQDEREQDAGREVYDGNGQSSLEEVMFISHTKKQIMCTEVNPPFPATAPRPPPRIFAFISNSPLSKHLEGITLAHTVSDAKTAIMRAFKLHPAKQSLYYVDRIRQTSRWMQHDCLALSSYFSDAPHYDMYIRVHPSFELLFKHDERWIIIPSATSDSIFDLKSKLAVALGVPAHQLSVFLPMGAGLVNSANELERELVHCEGKTLLSEGVIADLELRLKLRGIETVRRLPTTRALPHIAALAPSSHGVVSLPPNYRCASSANTTQSSQLGRGLNLGNVTAQPCAPAVNFSIKLGNFGKAKELCFPVPVIGGSFCLDVHLKNLQSLIRDTFQVHLFHQDFWWERPAARCTTPNSRRRCGGACIISGIQFTRGCVDLASMPLSETVVWRQFTVSFVFDGCLRHVAASAHETILELRRKLCAILLIECSDCSPVLTITKQSNLATMSKCASVALDDRKRLVHYGIITNTELSISCPPPSITTTVELDYNPSPNSATAQSISQPLVPASVSMHQSSSDIDQSIAVLIKPGAWPNAVVVSIHISEPVDHKFFSFSNLASHITIGLLKQIISDKFGIVASMMIFKSTGNENVLLDQDNVHSVSQPIECHLKQPSHIFIRLILNDGREKTEQVCTSSRTCITILTLVFCRFPCLCLKRFWP